MWDDNRRSGQPVTVDHASGSGQSVESVTPWEKWEDDSRSVRRPRSTYRPRPRRTSAPYRLRLPASRRTPTVTRSSPCRPGGGTSRVGRRDPADARSPAILRGREPPPVALNKKQLVQGHHGMSKPPTSGWIPARHPGSRTGPATWRSRRWARRRARTPAGLTRPAPGSRRNLEHLMGTVDIWADVHGPHWMSEVRRCDHDHSSAGRHGLRSGWFVRGARARTRFGDLRHPVRCPRSRFPVRGSAADGSGL